MKYRVNKYNAKRTEYNGLVYDSKAEARRAQQLDMLVMAGEVAFYVRQPTFYLGCPENKYRADFLVVNAAGREPRVHVEDVKGIATAKFRRDVKLWRAYGPCPLYIITARKPDEIVWPAKMVAGRDQ